MQRTMSDYHNFHTKTVKSGFARRHAARRRIAALQQQKRRLSDPEYVAEVERTRAVIEGQGIPAIEALYRARGFLGSALPPEFRDCVAVYAYIGYKLTLGAEHTKQAQRKMAAALKMSKHTLQRRLDDLAEAGVLGRKRWRTTNAYWLIGLGSPPEKFVPSHYVRKCAPRPEPPVANAPAVNTLPKSDCSTTAQVVANSFGELINTDTLYSDSRVRLLRSAIELGVAEARARAAVRKLSDEECMHVANRIDRAIMTRETRETLGGHVMSFLKHPQWCVPSVAKGLQNQRCSGINIISVSTSELKDWESPDYEKPELSEAEREERLQWERDFMARITGVPVPPPPPPLDPEDAKRRAEIAAELERIKAGRAPRVVPRPRGKDAAATYRSSLDLARICLKCKKNKASNGALCSRCGSKVGGPPKWKM
jgi:hypothetical protein